jgi:hypothetical protein
MADALSNPDGTPLPASRLRIERSPEVLTITIPVRRNWVVISFIGLVLLGWGLAEVHASILLIVMLSRALTAPAGVAISAAGLLIWSVGGYVILRWLLWELNGKEIIRVAPHHLTLEKANAVGVRPKYFDARLVYGLCHHVLDEDDWDTSRTPSKFLIGATGALKFKYQKDTVRFADGVDAREAEEILRCIRETGWLTGAEG